MNKKIKSVNSIKTLTEHIWFLEADHTGPRCDSGLLQYMTTVQENWKQGHLVSDRGIVTK